MAVNQLVLPILLTAIKAAVFIAAQTFKAHLHWQSFLVKTSTIQGCDYINPTRYGHLG
jgi:hypothetical protein